MRKLSARQAVTCENATKPRCKCRCGGALHGKGRVATAEETAALPEEDAHHALPPKPPRRDFQWAETEPLW